MSAQFFCVGVHLFLIISGYLYGRREILSRTTYKKWIISRAKRILIPMYIFMFFLLIIHLLKGIDIDIIHWLAYIFNLQGLEIYVHGAQHLWYLTIAMSCYFITPILDRYRNKFNELNITVIFVVLVITQVIMTYFIYQQFGRYLIMIELYIFAYFIGMYWENIAINLKNFGISIVIAILAMGLRLLGNLKFDGSLLYDVIIVGYTLAFLALAIFYMGFYIISKVDNGLIERFIIHLDRISYEIYLVHYIFIFGPLKIMCLKNNVVNCVLVLICTYIAAVILHKISEWVKAML